MNLLESFDLKRSLRQKDVQLTLALVCIAVVTVLGYYGYKWHRNNIQVTAQRSFSEALDVYKQALSLDEYSLDSSKDKDKEGMWNEVEVAFKTGYLQNQNSTLAPFFLAYESVAQYKLGKFDESYNNLNLAINGISKNSPYYYLYKIKLALFEIDKKDVQKGFNALSELSKNKDNIFKDMALFYLGEYYWFNNDIAKAKEAFQAAVAYNSESTWANISKERLSSLK